MLPAATARYRVFNRDGSAAGHCGNGVRCVARYLASHDALAAARLHIEIDQRLCELRLGDGDEVEVEMGEPCFAPATIPLAVVQEAEHYQIEFEGRRWTFGAVAVGNPHAVFEVPDVDRAPVTTLGAHLQTHQLFPARVNVGFMQVLDPARIRLRVFERGVGETPACGTGACAAVAVGRRHVRLATEVQVALRGGALTIAWPGPGSGLTMRGPATPVFTGTIEL
jgi:diaminopimelate epimerase